MADLSDVVKSLHGASLSQYPQHVESLISLVLAPEDEFVLGTVALQSYDFVPYALTGLSAARRAPEAGQTRPVIDVEIPVLDETDTGVDVSRRVATYGPGDVMGLEPAQIVRRYPTPGATAAEETFHAHIEFDRAELPWAFSHDAPSDTMLPWITLVALEESEVRWEPADRAPNRVMSVDVACLPDLGQAYRWAHAAAVAGSASLPARLSVGHARTNVSRLIAARLLTHDTDYVACVVPTTEAGVRAALGGSGGGLDPAWTKDSGVIQLPVLDSWRFRTAPDGDFARLAQRLQAVAAPWALGRRVLDTSRPGKPIEDLPSGAAGRRQVIRCALFSPNPPPPGSPDEQARWTTERLEKFRTEVERAAVLEGGGPTGPDGIPDLPLVGPRVYARGQRGVGTLDGPEWFRQVNGEPANRVVAGLGTRVVQRDQEELMQAAWAQVGEIDKVNRQLALAQLGRHLAGSVHARLAQLDQGRLLQLVSPLAGRVTLPSQPTLTLRGIESRSATPLSALGGAFRRVSRTMSPAVRRLATEDQRRVTGLVAQGSALRDFTRPYTDLEGVRGLSAEAIEALDLPVVAHALGMPQGRVRGLLTEAATRLGRAHTLATVARRPDLWGAVDRQFDPGSVVLDQLARRIEMFAPEDVGEDPLAAQWLGSLAVGLASTNRAETKTVWSLAARSHEVLHRTAIAPSVTEGPASGSVDTSGAGSPLRRGAVSEVLRGGAAWRASPRGVSSVTGVSSVSGVSSATAASLGTGASSVSGVSSATAASSVTGVSSVTGAVRAGRPVELDPVRPDVAARLPEVDLPLAARTWRLREGPAEGVEDRGVRELLEAVRSGRDSFWDPAGTAPSDTFEAMRTAAEATWVRRFADGLERVKPDDLRHALATLVTDVGALKLPKTPPRPALSVTKAELLGRLDPAATVTSVTAARLRAPGLVSDSWFSDGLIRPIMAAPRFDRPMYQALDAYDRDWLVPGLDRVEADEFVTLLSMNDVFSEAFLVGLSDEMARELLWRQYPTDQRGTYFHRFWDANKDELRQPIHRFQAGRLGSHMTFGTAEQSARAVVLIKGEIVRRYPDLVVFAVKEQLPRTDGRPRFPDVPTPENAAPTLFEGFLPPDIMLAGLDVTVAELRGPQWWIMLAEHPQAPRFGRTEPDPGAGPFFAKASGNGAQVAAARLAHPVRIAFESAMFLPGTG